MGKLKAQILAWLADDDTESAPLALVRAEAPSDTFSERDKEQGTADDMLADVSSICFNSIF